MRWLEKQIKNGARCRYCGAHTDLSTDHIIPKSKKGENAAYNYQVLCQFCNSTKGSHTDTELAMILRDIKQRGVWYAWEHKYAEYLHWLTHYRKQNGLPPLDFSIVIHS